LSTTLTLDEREIQLVVLALRFWRAQRGDDVMRRSDPLMAPETLDFLLAKLESSRGRDRSPEGPGESLDKLFPR